MKTTDLDEAFTAIEKAVKPFPKAALFELDQAGYNTPFELLVACILSIRTYDEVMLPTALQLFKKACTPEEFIQLGIDNLIPLINKITFYERKATQIIAISNRLIANHNGQLPCDETLMLDLPGVGPKCTNLVLGIGCNQPHIGVDIHVHRITNRWGYVATKTPEKTLAALEKILPKKYWIEINRLLVPFGKHICKGTRPLCNTCPVTHLCPKIGV